MNSDTLMNRLKSERKNQGISQCSLASTIGISRGHLIEIEKNRNVPNLQTAILMADALGFKLSLTKKEGG